MVDLHELEPLDLPQRAAHPRGQSPPSRGWGGLGWGSSRYGTPLPASSNRIRPFRPRLRCPNSCDIAPGDGTLLARRGSRGGGPLLGPPMRGGPLGGRPVRAPHDPLRCPSVRVLVHSGTIRLDSASSNLNSRRLGRPNSWDIASRRNFLRIRGGVRFRATYGGGVPLSRGVPT
jgi:hypothetical protein